MTSDSKKSSEILAAHLCSRFSTEVKKEKTHKTESDILAERICLRLVDVAKEMTEHELGCWKDIEDDLLSLTVDDFQVLYDLARYKGNILELIEETVNDNTSDLVRDLYGEFHYGEDFLEMYEGDMINLITFDPENCKESQKRHAAITVVQYFQTLLNSLPANKPGRPYPSGFYCDFSGVITAPQFDQFAFVVNGVLEEHALPEKFPHDLIYEDNQSNKDQPLPPSP